MRHDKDRELLQRIIVYCEKIEAAKAERFPSRKSFDEDGFSRDAVSFYVFQIGELVGGLSAELREAYHDVPWHAVRGIRNIIAHAYEDVDATILWDTVQEDIPRFMAQCQKILGE